MTLSAVIFDLDGTLLDTLADIGHAANQVLQLQGFAPHPVEAYVDFIGEGVQVLFSRALPEGAATSERLSQCAEGFREAYNRHWNVHTKPYAGICPLLDELSRRGVRQAVLSNKPHAFTVKCVEHQLPDHNFEVIFGQREGIARKPDPTAAFEIAHQMHLPTEAFALLGDTGVDMQTARAAGMLPVGALWGFRGEDELVEGGARHVIQTPEEFLRLM
jgi:phosphoglycolate phosphatase